MLLAGLLLIPLVQAQLCKYPKDITQDGNISNKTIVKSPIEDYVGDGTLEDSGCVCKKPCIRKCCPPGYVFYTQPKAKICMPLYKDLALPLKNNSGLNEDMFDTVYGTVTCLQMAKTLGKHVGRFRAAKTDSSYHLTKDGKLQVMAPGAWTSIAFNPDQYCLETYVDPKGIKPDEVDALICVAEEQAKTRRPWFGICMLTSCVFILATLVVYAWIPELQNMHGRVLMCYLTCLLVGFVSLTSLQMIQENEVASTTACFYLGLAVYTSLIATFFWLNVMCFDIYWTFSGRRGLSLEKLSQRNRFYAYCAYAFGTPIIMLALLLILNYAVPKNPYMPNLDCFLSGTPKNIYFYGPIAVICVINMIFFVMTAVKIFRVKKQTSVLQSGESATHDQQRNNNDKHRFLLYIKLFVVMGVNWILEIVSSFFDQNAVIFMITDGFNLSIGVTIFILFVCKKKIYHLIKKRYRQLRGRPMSRQATTTTSTRTMNKDEIQMTMKNGY